MAGMMLMAGCAGSAGSTAGATASPGVTSASSATGGAAATGTSPAAGATTAPGGVGVSSAAAALQTAYVNVIHNTLPSVVEISTDSGLGSGVIVDTAGHIVTNDHVVGSATTFTVTLANSTVGLPATLVGTYPPDDLAVIMVKGAHGLHPATFADSDTLQVGDIVLAMGNPLGLASSVTQGIVSATGRTVTEPAGVDSPGATLPDVIQTSAPINPGNSGGALVGLDGRVVGIPTLAALESGGDGSNGAGSNSAASGIGFAIPSNIAKDITTQLVRDGRVTNSHRAAIGATVMTVTGPDGEPAGVGIVRVTAGGPAAKAGLAAGDVITSMDGRPTPETSALTAVLAGHAPGQRVPVTVAHARGGTGTATVILGALPGS
jgi:putative serine protease PepD